MAKKRILIIDDEEYFAKTLARLLTDFKHYKVEKENNPAYAVRTALSFKPDLILLDIMMPEMDGGEVADQIRAEPSLQKVPIIFLTSILKEEEISSRNRFKGGHLFVSKAEDVEELLECIEKSL